MQTLLSPPPPACPAHHHAGLAALAKTAPSAVTAGEDHAPRGQQDSVELLQNDLRRKWQRKAVREGGSEGGREEGREEGKE